MEGGEDAETFSSGMGAISTTLVPGFVRMSIGIESIDDLWADIERGFSNV